MYRTKRAPRSLARIYTHGERVNVLGDGSLACARPLACKHAWPPTGGTSMTYEQIRYERRDDVAILTLDRPDKLNAWTRRMSAEMTDAVQVANADSAVCAIVMTGEGRGFCAGADVDDQFKARLDARDAGRDSGGWLDDDWVTVVRRAKPMVAAVNGAAVGIGMTMVLPFDAIVASEEAKFGMLFIKMGLTPELASTYYLAQRVGFGHASELCLSGRLIKGAEAAAIGLANKVVAHADLLEAALAMARSMGAGPDRQLRYIKDLLTKNAANPDHASVLRLENEYLEASIRSAEHREAIAAFREKRPPRFR